MAKKHRGAPLCMVEQAIADDFQDWCEEVKTSPTMVNMVEYLIQKDFIKGKEFLKYCDSIEIPFLWFTDPRWMIPLREGFIPPKSWIGVRE